MKGTDAEQYDAMIPWDKRLSREMPLIKKSLNSGSVLDIACASGRHSIALAKEGFEPLGIDISPDFIKLARRLASEAAVDCEFFVQDATRDILSMLRDNAQPSYFDNILLVGNSIASLGTRPLGHKLIENIYLLLCPGGIFFSQTVNRPSKPNYSPLRSLDGDILQRIMIPVYDEEYNVALHVNKISPDGKYTDQTDANHFYMYEPDEFESMVTDIGFKLKSKYGGYQEEDFRADSGKTTVWIFEKPDIRIDPVSLELFKHFDKSESQLRAAVLKVWQDAMLEFPYFSVRYYRFIYPRILSHPSYKGMDLKYKRILDIGCGFATDLHQMFVDSEFTAKLVGIEKSSTFARMGRQLFGDSAISLISGDFLDQRKNQRLIDMGPFDQIFTGSLLNVLSYEDNQRLFELVSKVLVPGGIFYGRFVGRPEDVIPELGYYAYLFSESEFREKMESMGFVVEISQMGDDTPKCERSYDDFVVFSFYCVSKGSLSISEWF